MSVAHHILVVEDHADSAEVLVTFLHAIGHTTMVAYDGESALSLVAKERPTLAIIDIGLGTMDGCTLARRLRGMLGPFPIFAVSAYSAVEDRKRASAAGIDTYFTKPVDLSMLEAALARLT